MINEILEYEQYTNPNYQKRLLSELIIKKNMAGIPRALMIIARKELADRNYWKNKDPEERKQIREEVTEVLKKWCFGDDEKSLINRITLPETEIDEKEEKILKKLEKKKDEKSWSSDNIYHPLKFKDPNIFAVNFPRIISAAISYGPKNGTLKQYYLCCDKQFFDDLYLNRLFSVSVNKNANKEIPECKLNGELKENYSVYIERLLKLIAVYIYTLNINNDGNSNVYIGSAETANWMDYSAFCIGNHSTTFYFKKDDNSEYIPIFENQYGCWEMNSIILKRYNFEIKEYSDEIEKKKGKAGYKTIDKKKNRCNIYDLEDGLKYPKYGHQYLLSCDKRFFDDLYKNRLFSVSGNTQKKKDIPAYTKNDPINGELTQNYRNDITRLLKLIEVYIYTSKVNLEYITQTYYYKDKDKHIPVFEKKNDHWELNSIIQNRYKFKKEEYEGDKEKEKGDKGYKTKEKNRCKIYDLEEGLKYPEYTDFIKE